MSTKRTTTILTKAEQAIERAVERGSYMPIDDLDSERQRYATAAKQWVATRRL